MNLKKLLLPLLFISTLNADNGVYLELGLGATNIDNFEINSNKQNFKTGFSAVGEIGYKHKEHRFALTTYYSQNELESIESSTPVAANGTLVNNTYLASYYYEFTNETAYVTSLGLGLGVTGLSSLVETKPAHFTFSPSIAVGYQVNESFVPTLTYRYLGSLKTDNTSYLNQHIATFGIKYIF